MLTTRCAKYSWRALPAFHALAVLGVSHSEREFVLQNSVKIVRTLQEVEDEGEEPLDEYLCAKMHLVSLCCTLVLDPTLWPILYRSDKLLLSFGLSSQRG